MPFKKGQSGNPKGRKKGVPNKATADFKAAVTSALNDMDVAAALKAVPLDRRLEVAAKIGEFAFPRLGRSEVVGDGGGALEIVIKDLGKH